MPPIRFGLCLSPGANFYARSTRASYLADLDRALAVVAGHFDSAWMVDHLQYEDWDLLECWTAVSFLAGRYPALRFGTLVLGQAFRNPALLAKMAASVQYLTGGRLILGLGTGWKEDEHRAYGYSFPSPGARVEQLAETLHIIRALWTEDEATMAGRHYRIERARCEPKPEPPPPIMVGGKGPRMLRLVARQADWWNADWEGLARYRELAAQLEAACREVGRDPATLRKTWLGGCACGRTEAAARAELAGSYARGKIVDNSLVGTPAQVVAQLRPYIELGVDYFIVYPHRLPDVSTLELLCAEVLPALGATTG